MEENEKWSPALMQAENSDITTWELPEDAICRLGQGGMIGNIVPSPDGKYLVVASCIGVWWYDVSTFEPIALWDTDRGFISAISFSPNGRWLSTGDGDGLVRVWDVQRRACVSRMDRPILSSQPNISESGIVNNTERLYNLVSHFAFSPDSEYLAVSSRRDYIVYVWHAKTGEQIAKFQGETDFKWFRGSTRPIAFSADGRLLACMMPDSKMFDYADRIGRIRTLEHSADFIAIWNIETGERLACLTEPTDFVCSLKFSPCGKFLSAAGQDNTIHVWNVPSWELTQTFSDYDVNLIQISYSKEGILRATGISDDTVVVWDVENGDTHYTHQETHGSIRNAHFSNGNQLIFTTESALNRSIKMWEIGNSKPSSFSYSSIGIPDSLVFASDSKTLISGCWGRKVMLWNITNLTHPPTRFNPSGGNLVVSASSLGKLYAFGPDGNTAKVWEIGNDEMPIASFTLPKQESDSEDQERQVASVAFAPTNNLLACGDSDGTMYVWDVQQQYIRHTLKAHSEWIKFIAFSPDEKYIVSMVRTGPVSRLWDVESGEPIKAFPERNYAFAFSPCSSLIACGAREILLWDIERRETFLTIPQPRDSWDPFALAFSPCNRYLASGTLWQRGVNTKKVAIRLWEVATGKNIVTLRGHCSDVQDLAFSPDSDILASGGYDGVIMLWDIKPYIDV